MNPITTFAAAAILAAVSIVACDNQPTTSQQEVAAKEPSRTPRPTLTPLPTRDASPILRQVTSPEDIAGVWGFCRSADEQFCFYFQYLQDGTYTGAASPTRERVENTPAVRGDFWFEGTQLHLNFTEASPPRNAGCMGHTGIYEVHLLENGNLRYELIEDDCGWRSKDLSKFDLRPVELT